MKFPLQSLESSPNSRILFWALIGGALIAAFSRFDNLISNYLAWPGGIVAARTLSSSFHNDNFLAWTALWNFFIYSILCGAIYRLFLAKQKNVPPQ